MPSLPKAVLLVCLFLGPATTTFAQDEDDSESILPGLQARYRTADGEFQRIDPDIAFVWDGADQPADVPKTGPSSASWSGGILVRQPGRYTFHLYLQGDASVTIDGQKVLGARSDQPAWVAAEPIELRYGEHTLEVGFEAAMTGAAIKLFWSAAGVPLEPVPAEALFRGERHAWLEQQERGGVFFDSLRCNRCHRSASDLTSPPAPALGHLRGSLSEDWLVDWLTKPELRPQPTSMPDYGFSTEEAWDVAAFLIASSAAPQLVSAEPGKQVEEDTQKGEVLFRTVGCLACHQRDGLGSSGPFRGGDLSAVGDKRSFAWLATWLEAPERLNPDHRMPVFSLGDDERRQLALYLTGRDKGFGIRDQASGIAPDGVTPIPHRPSARASQENGKGTDNSERIARGRQLVQASRCAACHRIPGVATPAPSARPLRASPADWSASCLGDRPDRRIGRPVYRGIDRDAIVRYVEGRSGGTSSPAQFERGRIALGRHNCLACHSRDTGQGIVPVAGEVAKLEPSLGGEAQTLIPPSLTAVGDKLHVATLNEAVLGRLPARLPWLQVRMPKFPLAEEERQDLVAYLVGHDRIPAIDAPEEALPSEETGNQLVAGHELVGGKGFSCVSCHRLGTFAPTEVALGTRGSDLRGIGDRMRREFFVRWTRSPLRVVAGVEMPSYDRPVPGLLADDLERQLAAVWDALNDPNFTAPTNPDVVEQYLVVAPGSAARLVRGGFTMPPSVGTDTADKTHDPQASLVPRAFAVGLNNGHNLLIDLDAFAVRSWWFGDFARQRTQGKTWLWDIAGIPLASDASVPSGFVLVDRREGKSSLVLPQREHATIGTLDGYERHDDGVRLRYRLNLPSGDTLSITETIQPFATSDETGWKREVRVDGVPEGHDVYWVAPRSLAESGRGRVVPTGAADPWTGDLLAGANGFAHQPASRLSAKGPAGSVAGEFHYLAALRPERLQPQEIQPPRAELAPLATVPGYEGVRLPMPTPIMPTALAWMPDGRLAIASLKGDVYFADDTDGDDVEDRFLLFEEGLAAPYGILADGDSVLVSHKPEVLRLSDSDGDGRADRREVVATGWGFNDNYHDWTMALSRDSQGRLYVGLGSDYAQPRRPRETTRWRGKLLRIGPAGHIEPLAHALRYPTGIAVDSEDRVFISDNQGVGNTFNEINHLVEGHHYGVPSLYEGPHSGEADWPAVQVPHPWTRSVNGLFFLPHDTRFGPFAGHGIGCEINNRFLVRFTYEQVDGVVQGAVYPFSVPFPEGSAEPPSAGATFLGPIAGGVSPTGAIYVASLHDSGWMGGRNEGEIVRLRPKGDVPLGIREIRAIPGGFDVEFTGPVDSGLAGNVENYEISGYTRVWQGAYETPDSGRYRVKVLSARVLPDATGVELQVDSLRPRYVYDVSCGRIGPNHDAGLWPAIGHYTMRRVPPVDQDSKPSEPRAPASGR